MKSSISFADVTKVLFEEKFWQELKYLAEKEFKEIAKQFQYNKLAINDGETKYLLFTSYNSNLPTLRSLTIERPDKELKFMKYC